MRASFSCTLLGALSIAFDTIWIMKAFVGMNVGYYIYVSVLDIMEYESVHDRVVGQQWHGLMQLRGQVPLFAAVISHTLACLFHE